MDSPSLDDVDFDRFGQETSPRNIFPVIASSQKVSSPRSPNLAAFSQFHPSDQLIERNGDDSESRLFDPSRGSEPFSYVRSGSRRGSSEPSASPMTTASSNDDRTKVPGSAPLSEINSTSPGSDHIRPFQSTSSTVFPALLESAPDSAPSTPAFERGSGELQEFTSPNSSRPGRQGRKFRLSQDLDLENLLSQMKDIDSEAADEDVHHVHRIQEEGLSDKP